MSYVDQDNRREKSLSGAASIVLVAGIGYALVTGLAINIIRVTPPNLTLHDYTDPVPPPPAAPPARSVARTVTPTQTMLPPDLPVIEIPPIDPHPLTLPTFPPLPASPAGPADGSVATGNASAGHATAAIPKGVPAEWVTTDDYPQSALRSGAQGRTSFRLDIGINGRVSDCTITQSSGSADLDEAACRVLRRTARFTPARDAGGNTVPSSYASNVLWKLPSD